MGKIARRTLDVAMAVLTLILMGGNGLFNGLVHEILGVVLFVLWAVHVVWNRAWIKGVLKGKYNALRIVRTVINARACRLRNICLYCSRTLEIPYAPATVLLPGFGMRLFAVCTRLHRHHGAVRDGDASYDATSSIPDKINYIFCR